MVGRGEEKRKKRRLGGAGLRLNSGRTAGAITKWQDNLQRAHSGHWGAERGKERSRVNGRSKAM